MLDDPVWVGLRNDFSADMLSQLCPEWRLRRGAILRWARGWYTEQDLTSIPPGRDAPACHRPSQEEAPSARLNSSAQ